MTPERFRRYWRRSMRRNKPISHYFHRTLRRKKSPASDPPKNPPLKALFFETEPLWPVTSFLLFSHLDRRSSSPSVARP
ncbi:hypothetical protein MA16_Dca007165 [Dendrobium catenatum]|uniref:Uncharacterized protein n=1 Tax=Dendrobium catenatum TaxID=906689 RepID=A0A2I0W434_9ASPA|nr:hypothetical protein MA16_Dca007165 [Dendrobium catenatum]